MRVVGDIDCVRDDLREKLTDSQSCGEECPTYSWASEEYGECSAICGFGTQSRFVYCMRTTNSSQVRVRDSDCFSVGQKPSESRACDPQPTCEYDGLQWSDCSATCGSGTQTRDVKCYKVLAGGGRRLVALQHCQFDRTIREPFPPPTRQACESGVDCVDYDWVIGAWGDCSAVCGPGLQIRNVYCRETILSGPREGNINQTEGAKCVNAGLGPKPKASRDCDPQPTCRYDVGFWSFCTVTCGTGIQIRQVECLRTAANGRDETVALSFCLNDSAIEEPLPASERYCVTEECPIPPLIRYVNSSVPYPPPNTNLDYSVRQDVYIIKDGSVTIDCVEIRAVPEATMEWRLRNGVVLRPGDSYGRFQVTENATLVITGVTLQDEGLYLCTATNIAGNSRAYSQVTVYGKPERKV